jgi:hypothetical protein
VLAVVVVCAAAVLLGRSRRHEQDLLSGLGMRPARSRPSPRWSCWDPQGSAPSRGAGVAALLVATLGPPGRITSWGPAVAQRTAFAALLAIALGAACAGVAAWSNDRRATSSRLGAVRRRVPWEAMLLVATVVTSVAVLGTDVARRPASPLAVVFPAARRGVGRTARAARPRAGRRTPVGARPGPGRRAGWPVSGPGPPPATPRRSPCPWPSASRCWATALAVHRGVTEGIDDKVAAQVGAPDGRRAGRRAGRAREPPAAAGGQPRHGGTVVYRGQARLPPAFGNQAVLAVDSRTFADAADWGASGVLSRGRGALADLPARRAALPVILAGDTDRRVGDHGTLNFYDEWSAPYVVVGGGARLSRSEAISGSGEVTVVARHSGCCGTCLGRSIRGCGRRGRRRGRRVLDLGVVDEGAAPGGRGAGRARITPRKRVLRSDAAADTDLVAAGWTTGYVVALGGFALLIVAAATLVLAVRLADRDAVSDVLLRRMSYRARDLAAARTWEVAFAVGSSLVAAAVAIIVLAQGPSMIEPAARVAPLTRPLPAGPTPGCWWRRARCWSPSPV